jgi:hypothetical protein
MEKKQDDKRSQQSGSKSSQPSSGKERENPPVNPVHPLPNISPKNIPLKPENDDPIRPEPGVNEPGKNDPTRIDEPPSIFNIN